MQTLSRPHHLTDNLVLTGIFDLQQARVLNVLIANPNSTAITIVEELGIPDSKVYPALKKLQERNIIIKDKTVRPTKYYIIDPEEIKQIIRDALSHKVQAIKELQIAIETQVDTLWEPMPERHSGEIAYIFKGRAIYSEVLRLLKETESKLVLFLSPDFEPYKKLLGQQLAELLKNDIRVELALPLNINIHDVLPKKLCEDHNLKIKQSTIEKNSYLISDNKFLLKLTHSLRGDVALLTNDDLLVSFMDDCWNSNGCCIQINTVTTTCC